MHVLSGVGKRVTLPLVWAGPPFAVLALSYPTESSRSVNGVGFAEQSTYAAPFDAPAARLSEQPTGKIDDGHPF
jgi:hypothetical protein